MSPYLTSQYRAKPEVFSIDTIARLQESLQAEFSGQSVVQHTHVDRIDISRSSQPPLLNSFVWASPFEEKAMIRFYPSSSERSYSGKDESEPDLTAMGVDALKCFLHDFFSIDGTNYDALIQVINTGAELYKKDMLQAEKKAAQAKANVEKELSDFESAVQKLVNGHSVQYPGFYDDSGRGIRHSLKDSPWNNYRSSKVVEEIMKYLKAGIILDDEYFANHPSQHFKLKTQDSRTIPLVIAYSAMNPDVHPIIFPIESIFPCNPYTNITIPFTSPSNGYSTEGFEWQFPFADIDFEKLIKKKPAGMCDYDYRLRSEVNVHTAAHGTDISVKSHNKQPELHDKLTQILQEAFSVQFSKS